MSIRFERAIPILRIFDLQQAREFYVDYLGFAVEFEHRFFDDAPVFLGIARGGLMLFLSEHHGDGSPGAHVRIDLTGIDALHAELTAKNYRYLNVGVREQEWGTRELAVIDPFGNQLIFAERIDAPSER